MRRIRVAVLATSVHFGGIERVLLSQLQHMDDTVELVPVLFTRTDAADTGLFERLRRLGVAHHVIAVNQSRAKYWNPVRNIGATLALFRTGRFDLVHSHGYRADAIALVAGKWFRLPLISTCHGFIANDRRLQLYNWLDIRMLRHFSRIIAVSAPMKNDLVDRGLEPERVQVITNAVPPRAAAERERDRSDLRRRLGIADDEFVFGSVGRLSREKGLEYLLRAAGHLDADGAWRLVLVGEGAEREALERLAGELEIDKRVHFAGFQRDPETWYAAMDALVLPSLTEGTPMALLEAMAGGLPVIATAVGGVPGVIENGWNGLLVAPADQDALLGAMRNVAADAKLRAELSARALDTIRERYDVQRWSRTMRDLYVALADGASRS